GMKPSARPGELPTEIISFADALLARVRWSRRDVERFMGEYLSEPKPHVVFGPGRGRQTCASSIVRLDAKARLLYRGRRFFLNGESFELSAKRAAGLRPLADHRVADGARLARTGLGSLISRWQRLGYAHLEKRKAGETLPRTP
ncbi:MAG TPA: winged helix domain-containing protein, partial [Burkholderiales bacterium]|nr:winged helix domain-containing protein [Burkholderiales bacterium]